MTPTEGHLIAALHEPEGRDNARLTALSESDWTAIGDLAAQQSVGPLLMSRPGLPLPPSVRATLRPRAHIAAIRMLKHEVALRQLAASLEPVGINLIVLKGTHLATSVYPSAGLREMADVDVLARSEALPTVIAHATGLGYVITATDFAEHHLPPMSRDGVMFEFHRHIDSREHGPKASLDALFGRCIDTDLAPNIKGLAPEDLLVHLCMHAADGHVMESGLRALVDVQAVLARFKGRLDWTLVAASAADWHCERSVGLILTLCRRHLGVDAPTRISPAIDTPPPAPILEAALDQMFGGPSASSEAAARFASTPGLFGKVRVVVDRIRRPTPESRVQRIAGLIQRHGRWILQVRHRDQTELQGRLATRNALAHWIRDRLGD